MIAITCRPSSRQIAVGCISKHGTVQTHGYDKYKRTIADVLLPNGTNVNHMLVENGWCWWY